MQSPSTRACWVCARFPMERACCSSGTNLLEMNASPRTSPAASPAAPYCQSSHRSYYCGLTMLPTIHIISGGIAGSSLLSVEPPSHILTSNQQKKMRPVVMQHPWHGTAHQCPQQPIPILWCKNCPWIAGWLHSGHFIQHSEVVVEVRPWR